MAAAAWVQNLRGETWVGSGDALGLYLRKGRKRWMKSNWKNMLLSGSAAKLNSQRQSHSLHDQYASQLPLFGLHFLW